MYVYNNTSRLINPGAKLPLLPGENVLTPEQAAYLSTFDLTFYVTGKLPWLTVSDERIVEADEDATAVKVAEERLKNFVEDSGADIVDATNGVPDDDIEADSLAAKIAARVNGNG